MAMSPGWQPRRRASPRAWRRATLARGMASERDTGLGGAERVWRSRPPAPPPRGADGPARRSRARRRGGARARAGGRGGDGRLWLRRLRWRLRGALQGPAFVLATVL